MDADQLFGSGNLHYVNEDYAEALKHYTCAVTLQEDRAIYRTCRAAAYLKLGKFTEALQDAEHALKLEAQSYMALHWKGIALFYLGDFGAAKLAFEGSLKAKPSGQPPRSLWIRKCDAELSGSTLPLGGIVAEASKASAQAATTASAAATPPQTQQKVESESLVSSLAPSAAMDGGPSSSPSDVSTVAPQPPAEEPAPSGLSISGRKPIKREWYQSSKSVFITIFSKGVQRDDCTVSFEERSLSVSIKLPGGTDEEYHLDLELFDAIEPSQCSIEVSKVKVELVLMKKVEGVHWTGLEKAEVLLSVPDQPQYPTSSKQKRDWSQVDKECAEELKHDKGSGDESLNKLFREIYEKADPETRRAMNKSFQTSGGTVLSTNWGEVARADYEGKDRPTPPDGQEWRDWRKK